jgi:hypothetical protein
MPFFFGSKAKCGPIGKSDLAYVPPIFTESGWNFTHGVLALG